MLSSISLFPLVSSCRRFGKLSTSRFIVLPTNSALFVLRIEERNALKRREYSWTKESNESSSKSASNVPVVWKKKEGKERKVGGCSQYFFLFLFFFFVQRNRFRWEDRDICTRRTNIETFRSVRTFYLFLLLVGRFFFPRSHWKYILYSIE